ncbi:MAG: LD-carboxypeptidase [Chitinophagaceae bacterium]|nr:LD-carboxypeptidase [Chitinophagaceae bacterium]
MNRKKFLSSVMGLGAIAATPKAIAGTVNLPDNNTDSPIVPRYLKQGDTIGITSPAGYITLEEIQPAVQQITSWGFKVKIGQSIGKKYFNMGGTDEERAADLQSMLDDTSLKAIMCARGGYGIVRIIDRLSFAKFIQHPKWIIGFSDATILHTHLNRNFGIASIHSKMCNSFPKEWNTAEPMQQETIISIQQALSGTKINYPLISSDCNKPGTATGILVGGNLKLIESMSGTASDLYTKGKILFVEDTGEYLYSIDRMFYNLKRTGKLDGLKGLIIGGFKIKQDDPGEEFGLTLYDIVLDKVKEFNFPVCFDFPVGHQKNNYAIKCGVRHRLNVTKTSCTLEEIL